MKEAVEEAFAAGLVKVVFATETLALGINMPARSVVIEKLTKFTGERHEFLTPGEYTQLTGRAGRRGIDAVGYAVVLLEPVRPVRPGRRARVAAHRRADVVVPARRTTWRSTSSRRYCAPSRRTTSSTCRSRSSAPIATSSRSSASSRGPRTLLAPPARGGAQRLGDVEEYRGSCERSAASAARPGRGARRRPGARQRCAPATCSSVGRRGGRGRGARPGVAPRRSAAGARRSSTSRTLVRLGPSDFDAPPEPVGRVALPEPYAPRSPAFQRSARRVAAAASRCAVRAPARVQRRHRATLEAAVAAHPVARDPERDARVRASRRRRAARTRGARGSSGASAAASESLARQFDRVRARARELGLRRRMVAHRRTVRCSRGIYTETRPAARGVDARGPARRSRRRRSSPRSPRASPTSAVAPTATRPAPPPRWPSVARRAACPSRRAALAVAGRRRGGRPAPRDPAARSRASPCTSREWARGDDLADVLADDELTGGDFVRNVKQCVDLLRQIADVAPDAGDPPRWRTPPPTPACGASSRRPSALAT